MSKHHITNQRDLPLGGVAGFGAMTMDWSEFGQQTVAPFVGGGSAQAKGA